MNISPNTKHSIYLAIIIVGIGVVSYTALSLYRAQSPLSEGVSNPVYSDGAYTRLYIVSLSDMHEQGKTSSVATTTKVLTKEITVFTPDDELDARVRIRDIATGSVCDSANYLVTDIAISPDEKKLRLTHYSGPNTYATEIDIMTCGELVHSRDPEIVKKDTYVDRFGTSELEMEYFNNGKVHISGVSYYYLNRDGDYNEGDFDGATYFSQGVAHMQYSRLDSHRVAEMDEVCLINFVLSDTKLTVDVDKADRCGWGHNVNFSGDYFKKESVPLEFAPYCGSFLKGEFPKSGEKFTLPFSCGVSLGAGEPIIAFEFRADGTFSVVRDGKEIFSPSDTEFDRVDLRTATSSDTEILPQSVILQDVTYDGYLDIAFSPNWGASNRSYDYFAYNPTKKAFDTEALLSGVTYGQVNTEKRTIRGKNVGEDYTDQTFLFEKGSYVLVREEEARREYVFNAEGEVIDLFRLRILRERINGKLVETKREIIDGY